MIIVFVAHVSCLLNVNLPRIFKDNSFFLSEICVFRRKEKFESRENDSFACFRNAGG